MNTALPGAGEARVLTRRLTAAPDPLLFYRRVTGDGARTDTVLFESADGARGTMKSLIVTRSAVRIVCRGLRVQLQPLTENGGRAVDGARSPLVRAGARLEDGPDGSLVAVFPALEAGLEHEATLRAPGPLDVLRVLTTGLVVQPTSERDAILCAGIFSYDLVELFESLPEPRSRDDSPHYVFWLAEELVVVDHGSARARVAAAVFGGDPDAVQRDLDAASAAVAELVAVCEEVATLSTARSLAALGNGESALRPGGEVLADSIDPTKRSAPAAPPGFAETDLDDETFMEHVRTIQDHIRSGDVFQAVLSRTFRAPCADPLSAYAALRQCEPSPYMFYLAGEVETLLGASPETAVRVDRESDGHLCLSIKPIAGTRARGRTSDGRLDPELDTRREAELHLDAKELAEHMMLVDLARNDVARVSEPGTRRVSQLLSVERYAQVMHLVSQVRGVLREGLDALHAYRACANMGTLTGAPKVRAAQLLREIEPDARGPYGGAVGYVSGTGELDTAIVIRSARVRDGVAAVRAGAGIVADSRPEREAQETSAKACALLGVLHQAADTTPGQQSTPRLPSEPVQPSTGADG